MKTQSRIFLGAAFFLSVLMMITAGMWKPKAENASSINLNKVDGLLREHLEADPESDVRVDIWIRDVDVNAIESQILEEIGINRQFIYESEGKRDFSLNEVKDYIKRERDLYSAMEKENILSFLERHQEVKSLKTPIATSVFAPVITAYISIPDLCLLANDEDVELICYAPEYQRVETMYSAMYTIRDMYVRENLGYSGNGMIVGMSEATGFPDDSSWYFYNNNVVLDPSLTPGYIASHASAVGSVIAGRSSSGVLTVNGVVPDATLLATYDYGDGSYSDIEWLLTEGADVINCSWGIVSSDDSIYGRYNAIDRWFDHIAINHSVHVVVSAGNYNTDSFWMTISGVSTEIVIPEAKRGFVTSPGVAMNVITVGALDDCQTSSDRTDDIIADFSSYLSLESGIQKPDMVAPGVGIDPSYYGSFSGTSFSAPIVAGVVAQVCQMKPELLVKQGTVKAILASSTAHPRAYSSIDQNLYNYYGAGCVDGLGAYYTTIVERYHSGFFGAGSVAGATHSYTIHATTGDSNIRVAFAVLRTNTMYESHTTGTPYLATPVLFVLRIKDASDNVVASSVIQIGQMSAPVENNLLVASFLTNYVEADYTAEIEMLTTPDSGVITYYGLASY